MKTIRWLTAPAIVAFHEQLISHYGGSSGLRAPELLDSALARPKHLMTYKNRVSVPQLAAAYGWGLLRNHPFIDGNKRIALAAIVVLLDLNGWELVCSEAEETAMVLQAASGEIKEAAFARWLQRSAKKRTHRE